MAGLARAVYVSQWAGNVVVAEFDSALALVWHVAVGTRDASLCVYALLCYLEVGMLCLEYRSAAKSMYIVVINRLRRNNALRLP